MNYEPIYESKMVMTGNIARRLTKMLGPDQKKTRSEWVKTFGEENTKLALEAGVLSEVQTPQSTIAMNGIINNGDYIVYRGDNEFIMYHMSDGKLWRTVAQSLDGMDQANSHEIDGIDLEDSNKIVATHGHQAIPPANPIPSAPHAIEIEKNEIEAAPIDTEEPPEPAIEPTPEAPAELDQGMDDIPTPEFN
jgi:hypothetical protein